jgi:hypothetical protein
MGTEIGRAFAALSQIKLKLEEPMKKIASFVLTALAVTALVLALSPVSARADVDVFPTGTYTTTITAADVAKYGLPSPYPEILIGNWELIFDEEGGFEVRNLTTGQSGQGTYMANPAVIIFGKDTGELACIPPGHAAHKWSASSNTLTLTGASEVNDRCWGRYIVFTSHTLVQQP